MSNRHHSKYHRNNHHTLPTINDRDSSHDPIASPSDPFLGTFVVDGLSMNALSAKNDVLINGSLSLSENPSDHNLSSNNITIGTGNSAIGQHQLIVGTDNSAAGSDTIYIGTENVSLSTSRSLIAGDRNIMYGDNTNILGNDNTTYPSRTAIIGELNTVTLSSDDSYTMTSTFATSGYSGGTETALNTPPSEYVLTVLPLSSTVSVIVSAYSTAGYLITAGLTLSDIPTGATTEDLTYLRALSSTQFTSGGNVVSNYWAYTCAVSTEPGIFGIADLQFGDFTIYTTGLSLSTVPNNPDITISYDYIAENSNTINIGLQNTSNKYETFQLGAENTASSQNSFNIGVGNTSDTPNSGNVGNINHINGKTNAESYTLGTYNTILSSSNTISIGTNNFTEDSSQSYILGTNTLLSSASGSNIFGKNILAIDSDVSMYNNNTQQLTSMEIISGRGSAGVYMVSAYGGVILGDGVVIDGGLDLSGGDLLNVGTISATEIHSLSSYTHYHDILVSELSGFNVTGDVTISGTVSTNDVIISACGSSDEWCSTHTTVQSNSASWVTGAAMSFTTAPTGIGDTGTQGTILYDASDANFLYICINTDTWKRTSLVDW